MVLKATDFKVFGRPELAGSGQTVSVLFSDFPLAEKATAEAPLKTRQSAEEILNSATGDAALVAPSNKADFMVQFSVCGRMVVWSYRGVVAAVQYLLSQGLVKPASTVMVELATGVVVPIVLTADGTMLIEQETPYYEEPSMEDLMPLLMAFGLAIHALKPQDMPMIVVGAMRTLVVSIFSLETLKELKPNMEQLKALAESMGVDAFCLYVDDAENDVATHTARMFVPSYNESAEVASASISGALGCYLYDILSAEDDTFSVCQGVGDSSILTVIKMVDNQQGLLAPHILHSVTV